LGKAGSAPGYSYESEVLLVPTLTLFFQLVQRLLLSATSHFIGFIQFMFILELLVLYYNFLDFMLYLRLELLQYIMIVTSNTTGSFALDEYNEILL
jgi:hypothetical protein